MSIFMFHIILRNFVIDTSSSPRLWPLTLASVWPPLYPFLLFSWSWTPWFGLTAFLKSSYPLLTVD
ncbi:hypothetical protein RchiOBHm_Chr7g0189881 [Rosa chinensis]|uniref:Uncharacterized protein n=1 Tax=Rosa chinensis TaxID=74649 RepID=A0A2P6P4U7_ROSCH|nr:hypothetical protein RchiOBHm_Chr7g0189881 [Rosa chinensis]